MSARLNMAENNDNIFILSFLIYKDLLNAMSKRIFKIY